MDKTFHVYVITNKRYGTLYTGVTSNLIQRIDQYKQGMADGFSKKYRLKSLVYYEQHQNAESVITREKQIKDWKRRWKIELIEKSNPDWHDLFYDLKSKANR